VRSLTVAPGTELVVHELGGAGAPALFAHATGFHGRVWQPVASRLTGFQGWAPDLRAHGDSAVGPDGLRWENFADDLLAVIDELGLDRPLGIGHSKGGAALLLAEERRPGTFRGLWCWEPVIMPPAAGNGGPVDGNPLARSARNRRATFDSFEAALRNFGSKPPMQAFHPEALEAYVRHGFSAGADGAVHLKCEPEHEAQVYEMARHHQAYASLGSVACPVVIARGSLDDAGPAAMAGPVADRLPHGRLEAHDDLGHFGPMEDPDAVAASIQAFAATL
jgi:pimeloyl-ACP methyl ester carboxylesterase